MAVDSLLLRPLSPQLRLLSPTASSRGFCSQLQYHKKCNTIDKSWKETVAGCHTNKHMGLRIERFTRSNGWRHLNATSEHSLEPEPEAYTFMKLWNILLSSLNVFYRFSRPHTVIGTALSIVSVSVLSIEKFADFSQPFFTGLLQALISALFMNIYIVGLNQLFDIEIDKVNKPTLPLASGEYSFRTGAAIVSVFAIMSFGIGWVVGSWPLLWALFVSFILGTAYSINDIPDVEGDRIFGIRSFSVRLGQKPVFWTCVCLLEMAYAVAIVAGATSTCLWSKFPTVLGHAVLALILWNNARSVSLTSKAAITSFYMLIWKLFYAEYLLIPLIR
ncbi:probable homogentisate phytyltransferase 1, chloroplastic isoform X2 [Dendrobium catenatum]|uniref:probable homogentisate phytyltransferase 1, chloroplastic isoform X2 n=1 Tax=Dendrobium catenatum TaxID=906689 RepID=UPI0009F2D1D1|nr:probable homogentisate phytyltransferase 1, chloroplastic isoform X2 [Dendrobium catenatum]